MSYRIEEKIPMTLNDAINFISNLKKDGLKMLYPKRIISSDYYDSADFNLFRDSEEGLLPRKKIRIRHYPLSKLCEYSLEVKISSAEGRYKKTTKLSNSEERYISNIGYFDNFYGQLQKKVSVTYNREYFTFKQVRITCDTQIKYIDLASNSNSFCETDAVIEIKAPKETALDYLLDIIPSKRRRFSKYCNAIKLLNLSI